MDSQDRSRDSRLQLGSQLGLEAERVDRRVADRLGAEGVEPGREMTVHPVGLDESHRRGDPAEQLGVVVLGRFRSRGHLRNRCGTVACSTVALGQARDQPRHAWEVANGGGIAVLE